METPAQPLHLLPLLLLLCGKETFGLGHSISSGPWVPRGLSPSRVEPRLRSPLLPEFGKDAGALTPAHPAGFVEGLHGSSNLRGAKGKGFGLQRTRRIPRGAAMSWGLGKGLWVRQ